jgi:hypothetical protein
MVATVTFNPYTTTVAAGTFNAQSVGYIIGTALDQPAIRYSLSGGVLASTETLPMWGGVAISEAIPGASGTPDEVLGSIITRATTNTITSTNGVTGFSVFDQNSAAVNSPQSPVPLIGSGGQVNFYRLGSGARIAVAMDPSLVDLQSAIIGTQVSWDFTNSRLQPYDASTATYAISSATWASTAGGTLTIVAGAAVPFGLGDTVTITGGTNTGTGGAGAINNTFIISGFTDTTHFTLAAPAASGVFGTIGGSPVINAGTGALNVKVIDVKIGNCMSVNYASGTGFATWNYNDSAAIILI